MTPHDCNQNYVTRNLTLKGSNFPGSYAGEGITHILKNSKDVNLKLGVINEGVVVSQTSYVGTVGTHILT